jgi:hypothetical protein
MSDLDLKEQQHVRAALRHLHTRLGTWQAVAGGVRSTPSTLQTVMRGKDAVSAGLAIRVARLLNVMVDDLLVGKFLPPGACPNCGHINTSDFKDEGTAVENEPRKQADLKLVT